MRYGLIFAIVFTFLFGTANAYEWHVPDDVSTVQAAINLAASGDVVLVHPGTYYESIDFLGKSIVVGSLYYTSHDESDISSTILNGSQAGSVVTFASGEDSSAVLCGLTITGGRAQNGGGIYIDNACPIVEHNIIEGNEYDERGGGIYREQGIRSDIPSVVRSNVIRNNIPSSGASNTKGGGIYITRANTILHDNLIASNEADRGAGIYIIQASPDLVGNWIVTNNAIVRGGGIYCQYGNPMMVNNMIAGNAAGSSGGGLNCYIASPHLVKNTIVNNGAQGIYITRPASANAYNASHATFNSCVVRGHTQQIVTNNGGEVSVDYSNIEGGYQGEGNVDCDPLYDEDYCLPPGSCCANIGDPALPPDGDGSTADIGFACDFSWTWDEIQNICRDPLAQLIWNIRFGMPGIHSQGYRSAGEDTLATWREAIAALKGGLPESCSQLIAPFGYELINDEIYAPGYWILREIAPVQNGWGTFIFNNHPDRPGLQVHVNHPIYDYDSFKVGLHAMRSLGAEWFLMAGTHRYANCTDDDCESDMARNPVSVFQAVYEATSNSSTGSLSFHAFSSADHDGDFLVALSHGATIYGDTDSIVVSPTIEAARTQIAEVFADPDICCVATPTNGQCDGLGATKNPQGLYTNTNLQPGHWLSVESAVRLTSIASVYEVLVAAIGDAMPTGVPGLTPSVAGNRILLENYPNPFNPITTIYFELTQAQLVNLAVYSVDGHRIKTLLTEQKRKGLHEVIWDGTNASGCKVASGSYFYRIEAGDYVETKLMMLLK